MLDSSHRLRYLGRHAATGSGTLAIAMDAQADEICNRKEVGAGLLIVLSGDCDKVLIVVEMEVHVQTSDPDSRQRVPGSKGPDQTLD